MTSKIYHDLYRFNGKRGLTALIDTALRKVEFRYMVYLRWYQSGRLRPLARLLLHRICRATLTEIGWRTQIGGGFVIVHPGCIAVNNEVVIGDDCTVYHGVTIGMEFRGSRQGNPVIGNRVWLGANATVVGNITVGDDVLIAPSAYVNFDVPSHSIVLGNPARIIPRENATEGYITRTE